MKILTNFDQRSTESLYLDDGTNSLFVYVSLGRTNTTGSASQQSSLQFDFVFVQEPAISAQKLGSLRRKLLLVFVGTVRRLETLRNFVLLVDVKVEKHSRKLFDSLVLACSLLLQKLAGDAFHLVVPIRTKNALYCAQLDDDGRLALCYFKTKSGSLVVDSDLQELYTKTTQLVASSRQHSQ